MARPSLHEIAAMPLPTSLIAMRRHYDPCWGVPEGEQLWNVNLSYEIETAVCDTVCIEADSPEAAEAIARERLNSASGYHGGSIKHLQVSVEPASRPECPPLIEGLPH